MRIPYTSLLSSILNLLPAKTSRNFAILTFFQIVFSLLDVLALVLLGLLSKEGLNYVQGKSASLEFPVLNDTLFGRLTFELQFASLALLIILLFLFKSIFSIILNRRLLIYLGKQSAYASREILIRLFNSKPQYVISKKTQELVYGITTGIDSLVLTYLGSFMLMISELFFLIVLLTTLLLIQPVAGLCALLIFAASGFLIHNFTASRARVKSEQSGQISVEYSQHLIETLSLYRELFLKGVIQDSIAEVQGLRGKYLNLRADLMFLPTYSKYLFELVLIVGGAFVAVIQLSLTDSIGAISSLVIFLAASSRILPSIIRLQGALLSIKQSEGSGQISLRQIKEFESNENIVMPTKTEKKTISISSKFLSLEDVGFQYPDTEHRVLDGINFTLDKGDLVAIVGESGAGKSTLADIILGIQEPTQGKVSVKGLSTRALIKKFPGTLAYVPQDISIVDGTIRKNIALVEAETINEERIESALKKAFLWEEVKNLPKGLESIVGERGLKLSGGQRQRLGIARAIFSDPELIVFDEATSSLDPITEKAVTDAIYKQQKDMTLIVIAHRLSTVKMADLVILLDKGKLIASGTFEEVRRISPKFDKQAKLVNL